MDRCTELAANLARVRARIAAACAGVGRSPDEVTLIVVTKAWSASNVRLLTALGVRDVGENRDQEAAAKAAACAAEGLRWHFLGQLQTNKCRSVTAYADVVHSVDRLRLVRALSDAAERTGKVLTCLVQVSLDPRDRRGVRPTGGTGAGDMETGGSGIGNRETGRGGADRNQVPAIADAVAAAPGLRLGGVMGLAPLGEDPRPGFAYLAEVAAGLRTNHPEARWISAGMSGDLEQAVAAGATHVRIGTAVLGLRPPLG